MERLHLQLHLEAHAPGGPAGEQNAGPLSGTRVCLGAGKNARHIQRAVGRGDRPQVHLRGSGGAAVELVPRAPPAGPVHCLYLCW